MIEDDFRIALILQEMLEDLGCEVIGPVTAIPEAFAAILTTPADAAILALLLKDTYAYEVAEALEERNIPFAFAGDIGRNPANSAWKLHSCLPKPYTRADVRTLLRTILPNHEPPLP